MSLLEDLPKTLAPVSIKRKVNVCSFFIIINFKSSDLIKIKQCAKL